MNAGVGLERRELSVLRVCWECNLVQPPWRTVSCLCWVAQLCLTLCDPMDYNTHQAPLSMGCSRQEYWTGEPFPSPRNLSDPGIKARSATLHAGSLASVWRFLKKKTTKNRAIIWFGNPSPGHISEENSNSKRYMHPNVHSSTVYNSQHMEAT